MAKQKEMNENCKVILDYCKKNPGKYFTLKDFDTILNTHLNNKSGSISSIISGPKNPDRPLTHGPDFVTYEMKRTKRTVKTYGYMVSPDTKSETDQGDPENEPALAN